MDDGAARPHELGLRLEPAQVKADGWPIQK